MTVVPYNPKFLVVPENIVQSCVESFGGDDNKFTTLFASGQIYKEADMTPLYLLDKKDMIMYVVAEETYGKLLN